MNKLGGNRWYCQRNIWRLSYINCHIWLYKDFGL